MENQTPFEGPCHREVKHMKGYTLSAYWLYIPDSYVVTIAPSRNASRVIENEKVVNTATQTPYGARVKISYSNMCPKITVEFATISELIKPQRTHDIQYAWVDIPMILSPSRRRFSFSRAISFRMIINVTMGGMKK